jgi:hypothetical protein
MNSGQRQVISPFFFVVGQSGIVFFQIKPFWSKRTISFK